MIQRTEVRGLGTEERGHPPILPLLSPQSPALNHHPSRGFTLIELIVVIIIVVVMMGVFLERMLYYVEQAEKTAMVEVSNAIQSALVMQYGQVLTRGKPWCVEGIVRDTEAGVAIRIAQGVESRLALVSEDGEVEDIGFGFKAIPDEDESHMSAHEVMGRLLWKTYS